MDATTKLPQSFYEIEIKSLLTKEKYDQLIEELPKRAKKINEEIIFTTRYRPADIRLRHSNKTIEIVSKEGDPTTISRKEVVIPLASIDKLEHFSKILDMSGFKPDPPWEKHKQEFLYQYGGYDYVICLQDIKDFAYILEVEYLSPTNDALIHEPNLKAIVNEFSCEVIEPKDFSMRIKKYIIENSKKP